MIASNFVLDLILHYKVQIFFTYILHTPPVNYIISFTLDVWHISYSKRVDLSIPEDDRNIPRWQFGTFFYIFQVYPKPWGSDPFGLLFIFFEWVGDQPPTRLPNEACFCCWGSLWSCGTAATQRIDDLHDQWSRASDGKHKMRVLWPIHAACIYVYMYIY